MWQKTYRQKTNKVTAAQLWSVWRDVSNWHQWQQDIEYAKLQGVFAQGEYFYLKPKGAGRVKIKIIKLIPEVEFTDLTKFPLAKMTGKHEFIQTPDGVDIVTTMQVTGLLAGLWVKLVAQDVADSLPEQTQSLINYTVKKTQQYE